MQIMLDDYNRLFKNIPPFIAEEFHKSAVNVTTFDQENYFVLKKIIKELLTDLGDYEVIAYTTGTEAIDKSIMWTRNFLNMDLVCKFKDIYHGNTILLQEKSLLLTQNKIMQLKFNDEDEEGCYNNTASLKRVILLMEPFFGDYFTYFASGFYNKVSDLCAKQKNILILDEIRSGMYRTGKLLFCQKMSFSPDIICLSKGLALGLPLSLVCFKKSSFANVNWKEVEIYRSSQAINSCTLRRAIQLITYTNTDEFQQQLLVGQKLIADRFSSIKLHSSLQKVDVMGHLVLIKIANKFKKFTTLAKIFKALYSNGVKCRFPEKSSFCFIFPFDVVPNEVDYVLKTLIEALPS